ncbi:MAG: RDD family protein [Chloroflexi bacterium]|nr:RDD family protein [Chloroflexota bacterium]MBK7918940.1 RDD family protein [Chloroflexota bacterium]MBP6803621.1 RDD family protein [Chloroflexota bacterium]MBP7592191.1 RDD family protein [Chloroflexota bacterium]
MTIQLAHKKKAPPPTFLGHYAGFVSRLIAFVIDILIVSFAIGIMLGGGRLILNFFNFDPLAFLSSDAAVSHLTLRNILLFMTSFTFTFFVNMVYSTFFWMAAGKTIGKAIMGLQVIGPKGARITFWRAMKRYIGYWISALPLFLGYFWVLVNDNRLSWHDKIAGTSVIYDHEAKYSEQLLGRMAKFVPRIEQKMKKEGVSLLKPEPKTEVQPASPEGTKE